MSTSLRVVVLMIFSAGALAQAPSSYQAGWDATKFHAGVRACREAQFDLAARSYAEEQLAAGEDPEVIRVSNIQTARITDELETPLCFCVVHEAAKAVAHADFDADSVYETYAETPACAEALAHSQAEISDERLQELMLE